MMNDNIREHKILWNKIERDFSDTIKHLSNKCYCDSGKCNNCIAKDKIQELWGECERTVKFDLDEKTKTHDKEVQ